MRSAGTWLKNSSGTELDSAKYGYNSANQRTTFTNAAGTYYQYTYDNIGQLKTAASSVSTENRSYVYDAAWNLTSRTANGVTRAFTVDSKNELTRISNPVVINSYDINGNLTNRVSSQNTNQVYDDENRLSQWGFNLANPSDGNPRTDFVYDGLGRLRQRLEYHYSNPAGPLAATGWVLDSETRYIYDGMRVIQERDHGNNPLVSYTRGNDLSGTLEGAGGIGGLLARSTLNTQPSTHAYYHADGNGNITYLVDSSQALAASYRYDPFGANISSSGTLASANVYRFSSKEIHVNSGMYYYGYRFYDPNLQRWINRDPLTELGSRAAQQNRGVWTGTAPLEDANLYYAFSNDPANRLDPDGRCVPCVVAVILGILLSGCGHHHEPPPPWADCWPSGPTIGTGAVGKLNKLRSCEACCNGRYGGAYQGERDPFKECLAFCYMKYGSPVPGK